MGLYVHRELRLSTGLADLLVESTGKELASISARLVDSPLARTMILSVSSATLPEAIAAADRWSLTLASHPEVEVLRAGPDASIASAVHDLYFLRRLAFASSRPEQELPERVSEEGLLRSAQRLRSELVGPRGLLLKDLAGADPLLLFFDHVAGLNPALGARLAIEAGHFVTSDRSAAVLLLTTRHSAFDSAHQAPLDAFVLETFHQLQQDLPVPLKLERAGVHRFAVSSELRAREDMQRVSILSSAAVAMIFLLVFRSLPLLILAFVPPVAGLLFASSLGLLLFDELHIVTVAFGSTLIGVCIDYPIHYFNHHLTTRGDPWRSLSEIRGALVMGAITSAIAFSGLMASGIPGIREIGVFAAAGVLAALAATCWTLPALLHGRREVSRLREHLLQRLSSILERARTRRPVLLGLLVTSGILTVSGVAQVGWQDDVRALDLPSEDEWIAEDGRVGASVSRMDLGRFVAATAQDLETALQVNDEVYRRLADARSRGDLEDFLSLHLFLRSVDLQDRNVETLRRSLDPERMRSVYDTQGFRVEMFEPFLRSLEEPPPPLRHQDLVDGPLADVIEPFLMDLGGRIVILTFLRDPSAQAGLEALFADLDGAHYFDQRSVLQGLYRGYRRESMVFAAIGLLGILGLLHARHRSSRLAVVLTAPALLAAAGTLGLFGWLGVPVNLLHLLGLLLVLGLGVDYAVFLLSENRGSGPASAPSSIMIAAASTAVAFGLLCLSSHPVLRSLGAATCIGVLLSLFFTFLASALWGSRAASR